MTGTLTGTLTHGATGIREQATDRIADAVETVMPHVNAALSNTKKTIDELIADTGPPALAALADAVEQTRHAALPLLIAAAAHAADKAAQTRRTAAKKTEELTGKKMRRRRRQLLALLGFAALAAVAIVIAPKRSMVTRLTCALGPTGDTCVERGTRIRVRGAERTAGRRRPLTNLPPRRAVGRSQRCKQPFTEAGT